MLPFVSKATYVAKMTSICDCMCGCAMQDHVIYDCRRYVHMRMKMMMTMPIVSWLCASMPSAFRNVRSNVEEERVEAVPAVAVAAALHGRYFEFSISAIASSSYKTGVYGGHDVDWLITCL